LKDVTGLRSNEDDMERLRLESRRAYLPKRETQQIEMLRVLIRDEEEMFKYEKRTKEEMERHEMDKQIINLADR
jgi:pre-mRNA-splicing factor ATP-dependent RNA helicase DHX16